MRPVFLFLASLLSFSASADVLDVTVSIPKPVVGLAFDATSHQQGAAFTVTAKATPPDGTTLHYSWSAPGVTFDDPTAATTTAHVGGVGVFYPSCDVSAIKGRLKLAEGNDSRECAAIGGPITISVAGAPNPTYAHDGNVSTASWYLTYYNYPHSAPIPYHMEPTQDATMKIDGQPVSGLKPDGSVKGTTISWTLPGSTYSADSLATKVVTDPQNPNNKTIQQPLSVGVSAEGAFKDGQPAVTFSFDDGVISGSATDDSADTQVPVTDPVTHVVTWVPLVYKVSGHKPAGPLDGGESAPDTVDSPPGNATGFASRDYTYRVLDSDRAPMPGVWVQERFPNGHAGINVNTDDGTKTDFYWITFLAATLDQGVAARDGFFGNNAKPYQENHDHFSFPWYNGDTSTVFFDHEYFAGTRDTTIGALGISLGSYRFTFTYGPPSTAIQTP